MKAGVIAACAMVVLAAGRTDPAACATVALTGTVAAVHDGDTFRLASGQSLRLDGIDAPELRQSYGPEARDALASLALGKDVACRVTGRSWDRVVARCKVDGLDIGAAMVAGGSAWNAPEYGDRYREQQRQAACGRIGLWAAVGPVLPRDWRRC